MKGWVSWVNSAVVRAEHNQVAGSTRLHLLSASCAALPFTPKLANVPRTGRNRVPH